MFRPALLSLLLAGTSLAADPAPGASRASVEAELGTPTATRQSGGLEISAYPRGTVTYRDGRATELKILSRDEWAAKLAEEKRAADATRARREKLAADRAKRFADANAARDALLGEESYKQLGPDGRLARIDRLVLAHPEADVALIRADLAGRLAESQLARKRDADAEAFRKDSDAHLKQLGASLADTRAQLAEAGARLVAAEKKIEALDNAAEELKKRLELAEKLIRLYAPSGDPVRAGTAPAAGGFSDSGPSH